MVTFPANGRGASQVYKLSIEQNVAIGFRFELHDMQWSWIMNKFAILTSCVCTSKRRGTLRVSLWRTLNVKFVYAPRSIS